MNDVFSNYIAKFQEIAIPLLKKHEYILCFDGIKITNNSVSICIFKTPFIYQILFSTHHLDYADGVFIYKSKSRKHYGEIILPKGNMIQEGKEYQYTGKNLDEEILRLTNDFLKLEK